MDVMRVGVRDLARGHRSVHGSEEGQTTRQSSLIYPLGELEKAQSRSKQGSTRFRDVVTPELLKTTEEGKWMDG